MGKYFIIRSEIFENIYFSKHLGTLVYFTIIKQLCFWARVFTFVIVKSADILGQITYCGELSFALYVRALIKGNSNMAQYEKTLATKSDDLNLVP